MNEFELYLNLANAIIVNACNDYFNVLRALNFYSSDDLDRLETIEYLNKEKEELERFFRSEWFIQLSRDSIDGEWLIKYIREQEKSGIKKFKGKLIY